MPPTEVALLPLLLERLWPSGRPVSAPVWIHGVSVGEVELAVQLAREIGELRPGLRLLATATTPAGVALLSRRFDGSPAVERRAFPLDLPFAVKRFFGAASARVLVLLETELWPAVLREAGRRRVAVLLANARLGERSTRRYRAARPLFRRALEAIAHVSARTSLDAERFEAIGVPAARISVEGDMKLDRALPPEATFAGEARRLAAGRPVWIAGSAADEELELVLDAHETLRRNGDAFLLLAPRRPESFETAARLVEKRGLALARRSRLPHTGAADVLLLDTLGELAGAYRLADVAFLGGTFAPKGGHNVLEPLRAGLATLHGPSTANIRATLELAGEAVRLVNAPEALGGAVRSLLSDAAARAGARAAAERLFTASAGATRRAAERALAMMDASPRA